MDALYGDFTGERYVAMVNKCGWSWDMNRYSTSFGTEWNSDGRHGCA